MKIKSATVLLACLLLLSSFPTAVIACVCDPPCTDCQTCEDGVCVDDDSKCDYICCNGSCCSEGQNCCGGSCCSNECCNGSCCSEGQNCCGGSCCSNECCNDVCCNAGESCCGTTCCANECCNNVCCGVGESCCGTTCCANECCNNVCCSAGQTCCNGECCDSSDCCNDEICCGAGQKCCTDSGSYCCESDETCCEGTCCDPDTQFCCDGSCCDKVWTKETIDSSIEPPCSSCDNDATPICDGTTTEIASYEKCLNVGVGQGEHCECNDTMQPVGFTYECMINWDVSKLLWCAAQGAWCVVECAISGFDPAACANCLAGIDCCGGPCGYCDFVEECKKNPFSYVVKKKVAFLSFGC